jgi:subtilisin family serine protease
VRHTTVALGLVAVAIAVLTGTAGAKKSSLGTISATMQVTASPKAVVKLQARAAIEPKLQYQLGVLARTGSRSRAAEAEKLGVPVSSGAVRVILEAGTGLDLRALTSSGARVQARAGGLIQASVPFSALQRVARLPGIRFVRLPSYQQLDSITGEEVAASNAAASIKKGWTGKGVKVAIIDSGFGGYTRRISEGELPANVKIQDFCGGTHFTANTDHGTAVAEIVHEMAPSAQLYLICFETDVGFQQAEQYAKAQGAQIITHSGSTFNGGRGDGAPIAGSEGAIVADARQSGILWVNSAGNSAERHWDGTFTDPDADGINNFTATNEGNGFEVEHNEEVCAFLKWDEWPAATDDYDLLLVTQQFQVVAASQTRQTGTQPPAEQLCFTNTGGPAPFFIAIQAVRVAATPRFDLFVRNVDPPLQYAVPAGSVGDPGASPFAFTAGAICWQNNGLEPYSGQGPTIDGRVKPDIAGQDSNSGVTYGPFTACGESGFTGTSASAPAVAGAAALVKEENPSFTADQIQAYMQQNAQDLGAPGPDTQFGYGRLVVPTPTAAGPTVADAVAPIAKALRSSGVRGKQIRLYSQVSDNSGEVRLIETVRKGTRTIATLRTGFAKTKAGATYYLVWRAPATIAAGTYAHCAQGLDRTGNKSKTSCATLSITRK